MIKKRVLIFSQAGVVGGAERYLINLVKYLVRQGVDVTVCLCYYKLDNYISLIEEAGGRVVFTDLNMAYQRGVFTQYGYFSLKTARSIILKFKPDVIMLNKCATWSEFRSITIAIIFQPVISLVAVEHHHSGEWPKYPPRKYPPKNLHIRDLFERVWCNILTRYHHVFISMNKIARQNFISEYNYPEDKTFCVYNGIEVNDFTFSMEKRIECRKNIAKQDDTFIVLSIARHSEEKGIDVLLNSVALLTKGERDKFMLVLVGDGGLHEELKKLTSSLKINENVLFIGEQLDVSSWISAADVFVAPSRRESFGLSIAEAMAAKRCVIASRVGGIPELVDTAGILVEPDDSQALCEAIKKVRGNSELREALGKKAENRIKKYFTIKHSMSKTFDLIMGER